MLRILYIFLICSLFSVLLPPSSNGMPSFSAPDTVATSVKKLSASSKVSMDQFIGSNGFIDNPVSDIQAVGFLREYHPWDFTETEDDLFEYQRWNGFWDFDQFYKSLTEKNITVCPVLWTTPSWLKDIPQDKPVSEEEDPENPSSYSEIADLMFQYAARYGSRTVEREKIKLGGDQIYKTGLGYLKYYEDWNEQDRTWDGPDARFSPFEYAAMASANADGHCGVIGENSGLKNADPGAKLVMGGLAEPDVSYLDSMLMWFYTYRKDITWPIDVINFHYYASDPSKGTGIPPEKSSLKEIVADIIHWRDQNVPDNEVWVTEFGYDTNHESPNRIPQIEGFTQEEIQAQWIIRTFLLLSSTGLDRAVQFMLRDQNPSLEESRFRDCGLTLSMDSEHIPKTSWYYTHSLKNILKGMYFDYVLKENDQLFIYRYKNPTEDTLIYALWSPTGNNEKLTDYSFFLPSGTQITEVISLSNQSTTGITNTITDAENKILINISETPVFIRTILNGQQTETTSPPAPKPLNVFPNPFSHYLEIMLPDNPQCKYKIELINSQGRQMQIINTSGNQKKAVLNTKSLHPGIYFLRINNKHTSLSELIVKNNMR